MPRKDQGWITFQTSEEERQLLEAICQQSQRTKTEVLREMLRGLRQPTPVEVDEPRSSAKRDVKPAERVEVDRTNAPRKPLRVSSRNVLEGRIKQVIKGTVQTEVTMEIVQRIELTSTITTTSAEALELAPGKTAYAVIKSSDVVIAMD